jgi:hypothetical protein
MKKMLLTILLSLFLGTNANTEIISIVCVDEERSKKENRNVSIKISFDENENWLDIGGQKFINGLKKDDNEEIIGMTDIRISVNEVKILHTDEQLGIILKMIINRISGAMSQNGFMVGKEYNYSYQCKKDDRAF